MAADPRQEIVSTGQYLLSHQLAWGSTGNISARFDDNSFFISASGASLGTLTTENLSLCRVNGETVTHNVTPSKEHRVHAAVYLNDPKATVTSLSEGENRLLWTVSNSVCPPAEDDMLITVSKIDIPSLITPNMDNKNDYFELLGIEVLGKVELTVIDRRGALVYENPAYDNLWHGTDYNGEPLPDDIYFYIIEAENGLAISGYLYIRN